MTTKEILNQVSEIEINYKSKVKPSERPKIAKSEDCAEIFRNVFDPNTIGYKEYFYALYLNRCNKVLGVFQISSGGTAGTVVDTKIIFQGALKLCAHGIIVCHNHPSGNIQPSEADIRTVRKIKQGAELLDMGLLDSLIINSEGDYYSFADEGVI